MSKKYTRKAYLLDEDVLIEGYVCKRIFYPNKGIQCGFSYQKTNTKDVNKILFYSLADASKKLGKVEVVTE